SLQNMLACFMLLVHWLFYAAFSFLVFLVHLLLHARLKTYGLFLPIRELLPEIPSLFHAVEHSSF
ncbi:MAG: hypothetical protein ABFS03_13395, partial [Chloroflexota bacterium]